MTTQSALYSYRLGAITAHNVLADLGWAFEENQSLQFGAQKLEGDL